MPILEQHSNNDSLLFYLQPNVEKTTDTLSYEIVISDIVARDSNQVMFSKNTTSLRTAKEKVITTNGIAPPFPQRESSIIFLMFFASFFIFSIFNLLNGKSILGNIRSMFDFRKYNTSLSKKLVTATEFGTQFFLIFQTILVAAILIFVAMWNQGISAMEVPRRDILFLLFFALIVVFILIRFAIYGIFTMTFFYHEAKTWTENYFKNLELLGILSFAPALFYVFLPNFRFFILILIGLIFILGKVVFLARILNIFVKNNIGFLFFIVYLCAVEILPYFLLMGGAISLINFIR